jgi:hypothetical protein
MGHVYQRLLPFLTVLPMTPLRRAEPDRVRGPNRLAPLFSFLPADSPRLLKQMGTSHLSAARRCRRAEAGGRCFEIYQNSSPLRRRAERERAAEKTDHQPRQALVFSLWKNLTFRTAIKRLLQNRAPNEVEAPDSAPGLLFHALCSIFAARQDGGQRCDRTSTAHWFYSRKWQNRLMGTWKRQPLNPR